MSNEKTSVGLERFRKSIKRFVNLTLFSISVSLFTALFASVFLMFSLTSEVELRAFIAKQHASMASPNDKVTLLLEDGTSQKSFARDVVESAWVLERADSFVSVLTISCLVGLIVGFLLCVLLLRYFKNTGGDKFIRGGQEFDQSDIDETGFAVGDVPIVQKALECSFFICGDSGSGKSQTIMQLLDAVTRHNQKAFIYDRSGDLTAAYYREGYDIILNPFDQRHCGWSIHREIKDDFDYERIARSFVPSSSAGKDNSNVAHWEDEPRQVLADIMRQLAKHGDYSHAAIIDLLNESDLEVIESFLNGTASKQSVAADNEKHSRSIISTLGSKTNGFRFLNSTHNVGFSLRDWVSNKTDDRRVFINVTSNQYEVIKSVVTAWVDITLKQLISQPETHRSTPLWFVFDEAQSLEKIDSLSTAYEEVRKFGGRIVTSVTSFPKFEQIYGEREAKAIVSTAGIKCIYTNGDPDSAQYLSNLLTKAEVLRINDNMHVDGKQTSSTLNEQKEESALFTPSQIQSLDELEVILKQKTLGVTQTKVKYIKRKKIAMSQAFVKHEQSTERVVTANNAESKNQGKPPKATRRSAPDENWTDHVPNDLL